jgi:3'-phosphoadenosine 5'-phosphosulfate sulfotransferase (PAPS reductase)/FAD synthetase
MRTDPILPGMPDALSKVPPKARDYEGMTLDEAIARTHALLDEVCDRWPAEHIVALFSGGNDSTLLFHLLHERVTMAALVNTTIRVPDTARYVRDVTAAWGVELTEPKAPDTYRDLVCGRVLNKGGPNAGKPALRGFPGPSVHDKMYQRLKERGLRSLRRELVGPRGKSGQVIYVAGMRWSESQRRFRNASEIDPDGAVTWCSPIVYWTDGHIAEYKERHRCKLPHDHADHMLCEPGSLPFNEVTAHLHMSGDCLCGAYAKEGEIYGLELFYPDVAAELHDIEDEAKSCGVPEQRCKWGWGAGLERPSGAGRLCSACTAPQMEGQRELFPAEPAA